MNIFHTTTPSLDNKIHLKMFYIASKTEIPPIRAVLYCEQTLYARYIKAFETPRSQYLSESKSEITNYQKFTPIVLGKK